MRGVLRLASRSFQSEPLFFDLQGPSIRGFIKRQSAAARSIYPAPHSTRHTIVTNKTVYKRQLAIDRL